MSSNSKFLTTISAVRRRFSKGAAWVAIKTPNGRVITVHRKNFCSDDLTQRVITLIQLRAAGIPN
jgi:hypothetical protein